MAVTTPATMTFEEFERLPDEPAGSLELLRGELIRMPPAERRHNKSAFRFARLLADAVEKAREYGAPLGEVYHEMGYLMYSGPSWLQPDVTLNFPSQSGDKYYEGSPMLVFEFISPSQKPAKLKRKIEEYLKYGALEVWIIYLESRHAIVHESSGQTRREDQAIRSPHLPGIEIPFDQFL